MPTRILVMDRAREAWDRSADPLARLGIQLLHAGSWEEARDALFAERVAAVFVDRLVASPEGESLREVLEANLDPRPPLVLRAPGPLREVQRLAGEAGACTFLRTGTEDGRLLTVVLDALDRFTRARVRDDLPEASARSRRVMVVDDSPTRREWLKDWFEGRGIRCESHPDGARALASLVGRPAGECPDLVVTDFQMPGIDGRTLQRAIHRDPALAGVRTVLYTTCLVEAPSYADGELEHSRALSRGALDFDDLVVRLTTWVDEDEAGDAAAVSA